MSEAAESQPEHGGGGTDTENKAELGPYGPYICAMLTG